MSLATGKPNGGGWGGGGVSSIETMEKHPTMKTDTKHRMQPDSEIHDVSTY